MQNIQSKYKRYAINKQKLCKINSVNTIYDKTISRGGEKNLFSFLFKGQL